jgi:hypothetical protein
VTGSEPGESPETASRDSNESLLDEAILIALLLGRLAARTNGFVTARLAELRDDLSALVVRLDPTQLRYDANRRARLDLLVKEANQIISTAYRQIATLADRALDEAATMAQDSLSASVAGLLLIKGLSRQLDVTTLRQLREGSLVAGARVRDWWARQSGDLQFRLRRYLEDSLRLTEPGREPTAGDLVDVIRSSEPGGLFIAPVRHAGTLLNSAYHAVVNAVRFQTIIRHPELFRGIVHISVLDGRTTKVCRSRSNLLWDLSGNPIRHSLPFAVPPLHYQCRSHLAPVMLPYTDLSPRFQRRVRPEDFTGEVSPEPDLDDWLKRHGRENSEDPLTPRQARRLLGL